MKPPQPIVPPVGRPDDLKARLRRCVLGSSFDWSYVECNLDPGEPDLRDDVAALLQRLEELEAEVGRLKRFDGRMKEAERRMLPLCPDHRDKQSGKPCLACRIEELESDVRRYKFAPLGDNHHNAAECPYCSPKEDDSDPHYTSKIDPERYM